MCKASNTQTAKFCYRCGYSLSASGIDDMKARKEKGDDIVNRLLQKPEVMDLLRRMVREEKDRD